MQNLTQDLSKKTILGLLKDKKIAVFMGAGGVGKTTIAAGSAILCAAEGRSVLAVTVDPSNRLRDALGLSKGYGVEEHIDLRSVADIKGSVCAMILDARVEMDRIVEMKVNDPDARQRIKENIFYKKALAKMPGTHEYTAMERIMEAIESGKYDLIILDTPPDRHAIEFLEAPKRLDDLLSSDIFRLFVTASRGASLIGINAIRWKSIVLRGIGKFAGEDTFLQVLDFILAFSPLYEWFQERARKSITLFKGKECANFLVLRTDGIENVHDNIKALKDRDISLDAIIVNKVRKWPGQEKLDSIDVGVMKDLLANDPGLSLYDKRMINELAHTILRLAYEYRLLAIEDKKRLDKLKERIGDLPLFSFPILSEEVKDLRSLWGFAEIIQGEEYV